MNSSWTIETYNATPAEIHGFEIPVVVTRTVRLFTPTRSALVLGSTQSEADVDLDAARQLDIDIVKRRSGGGAVLVQPGDLVWLDVLISRHDELWNEDVGRAFHWLGRTFATALNDVGIDHVEIHKGSLVTTKWSKKICFAGLGPGEATIRGKKVLGISQRRTRAGALFQASINKMFDSGNLARLLRVSPQVMIEEIVPGIGELPQLDEKEFVAAFLDRLHQL